MPTKSAQTKRAAAVACTDLFGVTVPAKAIASISTFTRNASVAFVHVTGRAAVAKLRKD
jgi:hypothetical protein